MRKPKKLTAFLLALTLLFACAACGRGNSTTDSGKTISGTLPEIIDRLYDTVDVDDEQRVASEPFINAIAFSVCLMRVKDGTDIDELKAEIRRSANPAKWICVDVNPNDVRVESVGDLVLLIMADDSEKYSEAFYALAE